MSVIPVAKTEIAFTSGYSTPEGSRVWTDVSAYVLAMEGISITRGRADELSQVSPSTCSLTLKNDDGRFTPERASSPYFPNVKKGKPIRVSVTYGGNTYVRFVGYIDEWPVTWPDGSDLTSTVTIAATSRRSRMGLTAPLGSAIRNAYLSTNPLAYWPMDEALGDRSDTNNNQVFADLTNTISTRVVTTAQRGEFIAAFASSPAYNPVLKDGSLGPTDEDSLVRLDPAPVTFAHLIGGSAVEALPPSGLTAEVVSRVRFSTSDVSCSATPIWLATLDQSVQIAIHIGRFNSSLNSAYNMDCQILVYDPSTFAVLENVGQGLHSGPDLGLGAGFTPNSDMSFLTDGEIHHYELTFTSGTTLAVWVDGVLRVSCSLSSNVVTRTLGHIFTTVDNFNTTVWVGHFAVHDRALTPAESLLHGTAATAASESVPVRVTRLAGYLGVPSNEVDAEASVATPLGRQTEKGRSAAEVLDEVAASTGGVLYDSREGHLVMQARNHRYNVNPAFTISTTPQEIEPDFTTQHDDRYLTNTVEVSIVGDATNTRTFTDAASVAEFGVYSRTITTVSATDVEAESAGRNALTLYAQPTTRISQVSVDLLDLANADTSLPYGSGVYGSGIWADVPQVSRVLTADIGTLFMVANLPAQAPASSMGLFLEGYTESISATGHTITMNTTPANHVPKWVLGSSTRSVLASTTIPAY